MNTSNSDDDRMPSITNQTKDDGVTGEYVKVTPKNDAIERYRAGERNVHLSRIDRRILQEEC